MPECYQGTRVCDCNSPCSEKQLQSQTSSAVWPSLTYTPHFVSLMKKSASSKVEMFVKDILRELKSDDNSKEILHEKVRNNFAKIEINLETMVYNRIEETSKYNWSTLFGTIGGNLGLWLGWSILSLLEFFQWMGNTLILIAGGHQKQNKIIGE